MGMGAGQTKGTLLMMCVYGDLTYPLCEFSCNDPYVYNRHIRIHLPYPTTIELSVPQELYDIQGYGTYGQIRNENVTTNIWIGLGHTTSTFEIPVGGGSSCWHAGCKFKPRTRKL